MGVNGPSGPGRHGVYPGSFNPPTIAHVAITEAAIAHHDLTSMTWAVSVSALGKEDQLRPPLTERLDVLRRVAADVAGLRIEVTEHQLLADIAEGYDVLVMGADKWFQIREPRWYGDDETARDAALARLPTVAVVPRADDETATGPVLDDELVLPVDAAHLTVSSTRARNGEPHLMAPAARDHALRTGTWLVG